MTDHERADRKRRHILQAIGVSAVAGGLAGCIGSDDDGSAGTDDGPSDGSSNGSSDGSSDGEPEDAGDDGDESDESDGSTEDDDGLLEEEPDPLGADAWPMRNFDASHTGHHPDVTSPERPLEEKWSIAIELEHSPGARYLPVVAGRGYAVTATTEGTVYAYDAESGTEAWRYEMAERDGYLKEARGGVALFDGVVYASRGDFSEYPKYAIDVESGNLLWEEPAGDSFDPVVDDDLIYGVTDAGVVARDAASGAERWQTEVDGGQNLAVANDTVYVRDLEPRSGEWFVVALDAASGDEQWRSNPIDREAIAEASHLSVGDGAVYTASAGGTVCAFDAGSGTKAWDASPYTEYEERSSSQDPVEPPVIGDERVFLGGFHIHALSQSDGTEEWSVGNTNQHRNHLAFVDGEIYNLVDPGIVAYDPSDGTELWSYDSGLRTACLSDVAVTADRIYLSKDRCGGEAPELVAIGPV